MAHHLESDVLSGAEPFSADGGSIGVLVLHGFTGNPFSMRPVAQALAERGLSVELPRLPGHGTSVEDLARTRWNDWTAAAEEAWSELAARTSRVALVGLSMGGSLGLWLAKRHAGIDGLALINPLVEPPDAEFQASLQALIDAGQPIIDGIGSDIARPDADEHAYRQTPLVPALSLFRGVEELSQDLDRVACPVLLLSSRQDHVVAPSSGDLLARSVAGPVERVWLERSYHVATLDFDQDEVVSRVVDFVLGVTAP